MLNTQSISILSDILNRIAQIDEFKGTWRALGTLARERLFALGRVATIQSIGWSTRIEGSKLTNRNVEALLAWLEIKSFATRDEQEVAGYTEEVARRKVAEKKLTETKADLADTKAQLADATDHE